MRRAATCPSATVTAAAPLPPPPRRRHRAALIFTVSGAQTLGEKKVVRTSDEDREMEEGMRRSRRGPPVRHVRFSRSERMIEKIQLDHDVQHNILCSVRLLATPVHCLYYRT